MDTRPSLTMRPWDRTQPLLHRLHQGLIGRVPPCGGKAKGWFTERHLDGTCRSGGVVMRPYRKT